MFEAEVRAGYGEDDLTDRSTFDFYRGAINLFPLKLRGFVEPPATPD
jgi:hypothetical protein